MLEFMMNNISLDDAQDEDEDNETQVSIAETDVDSSLEMPTSRLRKDFHIERKGFKLGSGAFGTVIKGEHRMENKIYAIKLVKFSNEEKGASNSCHLSTNDSIPVSIGEAKEEAKKLSSLHHPRVVRYYSVWTEPLVDEIDELFDHSDQKQNITDQEVLCMQMEYCETTMRHAIKKKLKRGDAWKYFMQILEVLVFLSEKSIVHSDLKPDNIFINGGEIKLGDFGLSYHHNDSQNINEDRGTDFYIPGNESRENNLKVDMFSLGIIFYEMLTFFKTGTERLENLKDLRENTHSFLSQCQDLYEIEKELIEKMLDVNIQTRPSAKDLLTYLCNLTFTCPKCSSSKPMCGTAPWITHLTGVTHEPLVVLEKLLEKLKKVGHLHENPIQNLNLILQQLGGQMSEQFTKDVNGNFSAMVSIDFSNSPPEFTLTNFKTESACFRTKIEAKQEACRKAVAQLMEQLRKNSCGDDKQ
ncbi:hypothetical protein C9374_013030 [Naegleria lovaniensis]|uniref:Protein kinase domain-containing protein n=1 Tax=Naegleria lovaniensis TaxID=51637 RepID=A0AA88GCA8_NAELO|nr:uncharacterized protein C9374_013030 [Naegleria lovaniensis]KAG2372908.1 hypothetical protein C9374_013030 [Naegleria lovaniensis]